ncbi:hypothetical protein [Enterococcus faecium]|uniref:hypothetical protein n=1 Tax=Enterococcus faecium TaxID=1352 RepID=UPI000812C1B4|nr:hypothetical protein [Enterococcus faecium]
MLKKLEYLFDGEMLVFVEIDSDLELRINFMINQGLYLGASKLFGDWMQEVYENREEIIREYIETLEQNKTDKIVEE